MEIRYKHQKFQEDAAAAVCNVFDGQTYVQPGSYMVDRGSGLTDITGFKNNKIVLSKDQILENIQKIQREYDIKPSETIESLPGLTYNLTIEMETGVGKTYTYIKTMYELNRKYGWCKFIVIVPSIAIREGVYSSFKMTQEHFAEEYGKKIRFFIYNSSQLTDIDRFARDAGINVMIINSQAFNAKGKDARRITMKLDEFQSRRPIDIIAKTNPVLIIDEPQSVEGKTTREKLKDFNPLFTLRYSATHKTDSIFNMIYRLDALDAYNKKLVKKISVKGITLLGNTASEGYIYFDKILTSPTKPPEAKIEFDIKTKSGAIKKDIRKVSQGFNLYDNSGQLEEYKDRYVVTDIDGRDDSVTFANGIKIHVGEAVGINEYSEQIRKIQIRETIRSHLEREKILFRKGIKVLSLFFIDEVAKYRQYNDASEGINGVYADIFEEEYTNAVKDYIKLIREDGDENDSYAEYLEKIPAEKTHNGYFSIDKNKKFIDSKVSDKKENTSDDESAYELIMRDKVRLLSFSEPTRFIFSHSALREGWDNPNVFQICTLKQSSSEIRKRQEVGRGLRLSVNRDGERMDENSVGENVHEINVLTIIASESYESFAEALQKEIAESLSDRPVKVTADLFVGKRIKTEDGTELKIDKTKADEIYWELVSNKYIDRYGKLTDGYYEAKKKGDLAFSDDLRPYVPKIQSVLDSVYHGIEIDDVSKNTEIKADRKKMDSAEFKKLWAEINSKTAYIVKFDTDELIRNAVSSLDKRLKVTPIRIIVDKGSVVMESVDQIKYGNILTKENSEKYNADAASIGIKYDLIGKIVDETGLTRATVVEILKKVKPETFGLFKKNPEEFITRASSLINQEKACIVIEHISYNKLDGKYDTDIFTGANSVGHLGVDIIETKKNIFNYLKYDSEVEKKFASDLDISSEVVVYVKLPKTFCIPTPLGNYTPDWAIAFKEGEVRHVYFVAETKGSTESTELRRIENAKIECARKHFSAISNGNVMFDVVNSYEDLRNIISS